MNKTTYICFFCDFKSNDIMESKTHQCENSMKLSVKEKEEFVEWMRQETDPKYWCFHCGKEIDNGDGWCSPICYSKWRENRNE